MKELLKLYGETVNTIFKKFDIEEPLGEILLNTEVKWDYYMNSIYWIDEDDSYSYDYFIGPMICENFAMFYFEDDNRNRLWQVFDLALRDEDFEV